MNDNIAKTYITKFLNENQATGHVKATTTSNVYENVHCQTYTAIQTEVTPKTRPQEEKLRQNSHATSESLPNANICKSGNNLSLRQNKENVKKTLRKRP